MKSERFDQYIDELGTRLKSLTPKQRQDEMREVRQHLEDLALWHMQQGKSTNDAVEMSLNQFGRAGAIASELNGAAKQVQAKSSAQVVAKFACYWVILFALEYLFFHSIGDKPTDFPYMLKDKIGMAAMFATSAMAGAYFMRRGRGRRKLSI